MTRKQKYLAAAGGCLFFYTLLGFLIIPMILTNVVPDKMSQALNRPVSIEKIRLNPYTLSVSILNMDIKNPEGNDDFFSIKELYVNLQIMSVFKGGPVLKEVILGAPVVKIIRKSDTTFNFSDLAAGSKETTEEPKEPSDPFRFAVSDIRIYNGTFIYRDEPFDTTHTTKDINWHVPFISNFTKHVERYSEPALACSIDGATLTLNVKTKPFKDSLETIVGLDISGISLPTYAAYIPKDQVGIQVNSGTLGISTEISFRQIGEKQSITVQGNVTLSDLDVADEQGRSMLALDGLDISILSSPVMDNQLHIGAIHIKSPTVSIVREENQILNVAQVLKTPSPAPEAPVEAEPEQPRKEEQATDDQTQPSSPFWVDLSEFQLTGGTIRFTDHATKSKAQAVETALKDLNIKVTGFSNRPNTPASYNLTTTLNDTAGLTFGGQFTADPLSVKCDLDLSNVDLAWSQPYLPETIALVINKGLVSTSASIDISLPEDSPMALTVTGKTEVKDFATVDPEKAESFLSWSDFTVDGIQVAMEPLKISVDTISFKDLSNQVVIFKDGKTNLEKIFVSSDGEPEKNPDVAPQPAKEEEKKDVIPIRIGKVSLSNTNLSFMDRSISPHYATRLTLNSLDVTGLTSEDFKAATVKADGNVDGYAPVKITGTLNPLSKDLFVDLGVTFSNVEMVPFSTYTGKYIGKAIEKGKLTIGVTYLIKEKAIDAENNLVLDQFTLGKNVDSPDAMSLPVGLAISLLKDRNGVIGINLPIAGRTDDPEFKWGKTVLKALGNLIMKAATSPFSLVSSLVGGGEELRYIEFQPGKANLSDDEHKKLTAIHKLLVERPGLKLDILGYVDADTDRSALAALALERKIKAPEIMKAIKKGSPDTPETVSAIVQAPEDRDKALRRLYKKEILATPPEGRTPKSLKDPTLTSEDMVSALTGIIPITDADLGLLAIARAREVISALLSDGAIPAERIYLREPETLTPPEADGFKLSRVELQLK